MFSETMSGLQPAFFVVSILITVFLTALVTGMTVRNRLRVREKNDREELVLKVGRIYGKEISDLREEHKEELKKKDETILTLQGKSDDAWRLNGRLQREMEEARKAKKKAVAVSA